MLARSAARFRLFRLVDVDLARFREESLGLPALGKIPADVEILLAHR